MHVTVAVAGPSVCVAGAHVHDAIPLLLAVSVVRRWLLVAACPDAYTTATVHCAPARVVAITVVSVPSVVGFGFTCTRTDSVPDDVAVVVATLVGVGTAAPLHRMERTGCNSMALGATPLCPCL